MSSVEMATLQSDSGHPTVASSDNLSSAISPQLKALLHQRSLWCVRCNVAPLQIEPSSGKKLSCPHCHSLYPVIHGVPVLFPDVLMRNSAVDMSADFSTQLSQLLGINPDANTLATIHGIFAQDYEFGNMAIAAENQFLERMRHCFNLDIAQVSNHSASLATATASDQTVQYRWLLDYLPRQMLADHRFTGNVRLENLGRTIDSTGPNPVQVAYRWWNAQGELIVADGLRTPLPIPLESGQKLTLPMQIKTPKTCGDYELQLLLVHEGVQWIEQGAWRLPIQIVKAQPTDSSQSWTVLRSAPISYEEDHRIGLEMLKRKLAAGGIENPKLLEVGGNVHPMINALPGDRYNLDVDLYGLQLGQLLVNQMEQTVQCICADAETLPFADDYFDAIFMFSTLHHFPDPRLLLQQLTRKLKPSGFLAVMSEPIGHYLGKDIAPDLLQELQKGVNEQNFILSEYAAIFKGAGLEAQEVTIQGGSLKAFLVPATWVG